MEVGSHVNIFSLLWRPNKWSQASLSGLHIEEHDHAHAKTIIGDDQLPNNDDPEFAALAADFTRPTKEEIPGVHIHNNKFWNSFNAIWSANFLSKQGESIQADLDCIAAAFMYQSHAKHLALCGGPRRIPFYLASLKVRGKLTGVGSYVQPKDNNMPLTIFVSAKGQGPLCSAEHIVPYMLFQAILKYERNPSVDSYAVFVVSMKGTNIQFNKGVVSREYLKDLISQRVPADPLVFLRSEPYDLHEQDDRKECLRAFIGLIRTLKLECV